MKKPNIDFSKQGMQRFALHHIEKVILGLALAGFLAFFWLGMKTETFSSTDPQKLAQKAEEARSYIGNPDSWTKVADLRVARDNVDDQVAKAEQLALDGYLYDIFGGIAVRSLGLRNDPDIGIAKPTDAEIDVFSAAVLVLKEPFKISGDSELDKLPSAAMVDVDTDNDKKVEEESEFGEQLTELQSLTTRGLRPSNLALDTTRHMSHVTDVVSIRALVRHKEFWEDFEKKLENSFGYFPLRDRPDYQLVQVQRKLSGADSKWEDITSLIQQYRKAFEVGGIVPEVIAPLNYDDALCGSIPPMPWVDYREIGTHSSLPTRSFEPTMSEDSVGDETGDKSEDSGNRDGLFGNFGQNDDDEENRDSEDNSPIRQGSDTSAYQADLDIDEPAHEFKVVRFFDLERKKPDTEYLYRFRIWTADPNNEVSTEPVNAGGPDGGNKGGGREGGGRNIGGLGGDGGAGGFSGGEGLGGSDGDGRGQLGGGGIPGGGRGGAGDKRGGGGGGGNEKENYVKTPITASQMHISVRNRIDAERIERQTDRELRDFVKLAKDNFSIDLAGSRPTEWVEVSVKTPASKGSQSYAGRVAAKETRNSAGQSVQVGDLDAKILISDWSNKFGTFVSTYRTVRRGDWLGGRTSKPLHVLHLVDQSIRKLTDYAFQPKQFVVDIMGGEKISLRSPVDYNMPGEILIMDLENNEFIVRNSLDDKTEILNRRFQEDESAEYNLRTPRAEESKNNDDGRGGIGGLSGGGG